MSTKTDSTPDPKSPADERTEARAVDRRLFLGGASAGVAGVLLGSKAKAQGVTGTPAGTLPDVSLDGDALFGDDAKGPQTPFQRRLTSFQIRVDAAQQNLVLPPVHHKNNGDEERYSDLRGTYSKGLPHNAFGEVNHAAFNTFCNALENGSPAAFEAVTMGNPGGGGPPPGITPVHRLINPQAGLAFDLEGTDSHQLTQPPAPKFRSAWQAGEIVENYWMAHLRDVPFRQYATHPLAASAIADLNAMSDFRGPKQAGQVTAQTLFRESFPGCTVGPYLSQFFYLSQPFGGQLIDPRALTTAPGIDYMTDTASWLARQNGINPLTGDVPGGLVWMRNGRDIGQWVHIDVLFQGYFQAFLTLAALGVGANPGNPYNASATQIGFGTLGGPNFAALVCEVATRALKAVWFQKWFVHRRLRPEVMAGRIHFKLASGRPYDIHPDALGSAGVALAFSNNGTYLLPMAFPEGSPAHPAYGAGHATVAGACVTILKAMFDCEQPLGNFTTLYEPTDDGLGLNSLAYDPAITITGELNKLGANVAIGRNIAGVHWRTDGTESMLLGEKVAISVLRDQKLTYNESASYTFRKFDGSMITI